MGQNIKILIMAVVLINTALINVKITVQSYHDFYYEKSSEDRLRKNKAYQTLVQMTDIPILREFSSYTGFDTGYGFFGPNVASEYVPKLRTFDKKDQLLTESTFFPFKQKESQIRMSSSFMIFQDLLQDNSDTSSLIYQTAKVYLRTVARRLSEVNSETSKCKVSMFLYYQPLLCDIKKDAKAENKYYYLTNEIFEK